MYPVDPSLSLLYICVTIQTYMALVVVVLSAIYMCDHTDIHGGSSSSALGYIYV